MIDFQNKKEIFLNTATIAYVYHLAQTFTHITEENEKEDRFCNQNYFLFLTQMDNLIQTINMLPVEKDYQCQITEQN